MAHFYPAKPSKMISFKELQDTALVAGHTLKELLPLG
jgi:hypothetical protein